MQEMRRQVLLILAVLKLLFVVEVASSGFNTWTQTSIGIETSCPPTLACAEYYDSSTGRNMVCCVEQWAVGLSGSDLCAWPLEVGVHSDERAPLE